RRPGRAGSASPSAERDRAGAARSDYAHDERPPGVSPDAEHPAQPAGHHFERLQRGGRDSQIPRRRHRRIHTEALYGRKAGGQSPSRAAFQYRVTPADYSPASSFSAISSNFLTVFQFLPVPGVFSIFSTASH